MPIEVRVNVSMGLVEGLIGVVAMMGFAGAGAPVPPGSLARAGTAESSRAHHPPIMTEQAMVLKLATRTVMLTLPLDLICHESTRDLSC